MQKTQLKDEFDKFRTLSKQEVSRLERQKTEIESAISSVRLELNSELPGGGTPSNMMKQSLTSEFSMRTEDVEELRQQLASASIELEEHKAAFKRNFNKNHKELELTYEEIDNQTAEEKKLRVKINQLENDLEH